MTVQVFPVLQSFEKDLTKIVFTINQLSRGLTAITTPPLTFGSPPNTFVYDNTTVQVSPYPGSIVPFVFETQLSDNHNIGVGFNPDGYGTTTNVNQFLGFFVSTTGGAAPVGPVPAGTKGMITCFEAILTTNQVAADTSVTGDSGHGFGITLTNNGGAAYDGIDCSIILNTTINASFRPAGVKVDVVNNIGGQPCTGVEVGSDGSQIIDAGFMCRGGNMFSCLFATTGNYTQGVDLTSGTFSGKPFASPGFSVDGAGRVLTGTGTTAGSDVFGNTPAIQWQGSPGGAAMFAKYQNNANAPYITFVKSRGASVGTKTSVNNNDQLMYISADGYDATGTAVLQESASIVAAVDAAPTAGSVPGRLIFSTAPSGSATASERMRIDSTGAAFFPSVGTTATAANAFLNNASTPANSLLRSTSSLRYKDNVTDLPAERLAAATLFRPIEYNSKASADDPSTRFVGYAAEDVAAVDPSLVNYDNHGRPDGVMYDRVLLLQIVALQKRVLELERRLFACPTL